MDVSYLKEDDYLQQYKLISAKLKKRFLRKPNVAEACEQFEQLERTLSDRELWTGAGLCCVAVARCHQTLANSHAEADAITQAARCYAKAEQAASSIMCPSFGDHLLTASSCYRRAIALHTAPPDGHHANLATSAAAAANTVTGAGGAGAADAVTDDSDQLQRTAAANTAAAASLSLELATTLQKCDRCSEALPALQAAAELLQEYPVQQLQALQQLQHCYTLLGDLDGALRTCVTMMATAWQQQGSGGTAKVQQNNSNNRAPQRLADVTAGFREILSSVEVQSLLLLLLLQPLPQRTPEPLQQLLHKYATQNSTKPTGEAPFSSRSLFCLLQCFTLAVRARDEDAVQLLLEPLTALLHHLPLHLHLLHLIVREVSRG